MYVRLYTRFSIGALTCGPPSLFKAEMMRKFFAVHNWKAGGRTETCKVVCYGLFLTRPAIISATKSGKGLPDASECNMGSREHSVSRARSPFPTVVVKVETPIDGLGLGAGKRAWGALVI